MGKERDFQNVYFNRLTLWILKKLHGKSAEEADRLLKDTIDKMRLESQNGDEKMVFNNFKSINFQY